MVPLGFYHPLVVHFVIALVPIAALLRWISFTNRARFAGPAALLVIFLATAAALGATLSGNEARVTAETVPGCRPAVVAHGLWGERVRNVLLAVSALEAIGLIGAAARWARSARLMSGLLCAAAMFCVFEAGRRGGELVYGYAVGVGTRSGDPADVERLLLAGLYRQAMIDQHNGRSADAAGLIDLAARRFPDNHAVQILDAESLLRRREPAAALAVLSKMEIPSEEALRFRREWLMARAFESLGRKEAARRVLKQLHDEFPRSEEVRDRLRRLG